MAAASTTIRVLPATRAICAPASLRARLHVVRAMASGSNALSQPVKVGSLALAHKVVMSAMTRLRMAAGTEAPTELTTTYYTQRSSPGGLIITECIHSDALGRGYVRAPGLWSDVQKAGWKKVTDSVHSNGGFFFAQIFHAGRISHPSLVGGGAILSASDVQSAGKLYVEGGKKEDFGVPRPMTEEDIKKTIAGFAATSKAAVTEAGFDGVEVHAGNGYLLQQFLALKTNKRTDKYGGSVENRARLLLEVVDAVAAEIGPDRVGVKLQPGITFSDLIEPEEDVLAQLAYLGPELAKRSLAYVCLSSMNGPVYSKVIGLEKAHISMDVWKYFRERYTGTLMINGGISVEAAEEYAKDGTAELVSFGVPFIANANLPDLIAAGYGSAQLNPGGYSTAVWYSKDPANDATGYTDWPLVVPEVVKA